MYEPDIPFTITVPVPSLPAMVVSISAHFNILAKDHDE
jgi:hypothetical protein